jgi:CxxC-x17-CxxC domain-containing protein
VYNGSLSGDLYTQEVNIMGYRERRSFGAGPREMHKATCADCGKECEVPFKPTEGKPVYCRDCYAKHRPPRRY